VLELELDGVVGQVGTDEETGDHRVRPFGSEV